MITSISHSTPFVEFCGTAADDDKLYAHFKRNPIFRGILEHVTWDQGQVYYDHVREHFPELLEKLPACQVNDKVGEPITHKYDFGEFSPTTLRYLKVATDLAYHFGNLGDLNVLEIGGGYGGQLVLCETLCGFKSWTMVDLPEVLKLQQRYLGEVVPMKKPVIKYVSCYELSDERYDLVISNFGFSECVRSYQDKYVETYMSHGEKIYMAMNFVQNEVYPEFKGMHTTEELVDKLGVTAFAEVPMTDKRNAILIRGHDRGDLLCPAGTSGT